MHPTSSLGTMQDTRPFNALPGTPWQRACIHIVIPSIFLAIIFCATLYQIYEFKSNDFDFALFNNIIWNFAQGNGWYASLYLDQGVDRANFLTDHISFYIPILGQLIKVFPSPYALGVVHAALISLSYFLVPLLVREIWRDGKRSDYLTTALFLMLTLFVYKGYNSAWRFQTHMTTLSTPFILCALIALHRNSLRWAVIWCFLLCMGQERSAIAACGIGMYAFLVTKHPRFGVCLCGLSTAYFFTVVKIIIPSFQTQANGYIYNTLISPLSFVDEKLIYLLNLFTYMFFMPFAGKQALKATISTLPLIALALISNRTGMFRFGMHYQDLISMLLIAASGHGLLYITGQPWFARIPRYAAVSVAIVLLAISIKYARHTLPLQAITRMKFTPELAQLNDDIKKYLNVPAHLTVYPANKLSARFAFRKNIEALRFPRTQQPFQQSAVFVAYNVSTEDTGFSNEMYIKNLDANPTLRLVEDTGELRVYTSIDSNYP